MKLYYQDVDQSILETIIRKCRYSPIFSEFLNGKIDRQELIKKMNEAECKDIPDFQPFEEINIVDLETKKEKTVRLVAVD